MLIPQELQLSRKISRGLKNFTSFSENFTSFFKNSTNFFENFTNFFEKTKVF